MKAKKIKKNLKINLRKFLLKKILLLTLVAWWTLIFMSYGEIVIKNVKPNPQYSNWNVIVNIIESMER